MQVWRLIWPEVRACSCLVSRNVGFTDATLAQARTATFYVFKNIYRGSDRFKHYLLTFAVSIHSSHGFYTHAVRTFHNIVGGS